MSCYSFWFCLFSSIVIVNCLYFPSAVINISLPDVEELAKKIPAVTKLHVAGKPQSVDDVLYTVGSESTPGLLYTDGDYLKINPEVLTYKNTVVSKHQTVTVKIRSEVHDFANTTINLRLVGDELNCEKAKRNLCFWDEASYRVFENQGPTQIGYVAPSFYSELCKNYSLKYQIIKGYQYVEMHRIKNKNNNFWILSTTAEINADTPDIRFRINCTVSSTKNVENFEKEFPLTVIRKESLQIFFNTKYKFHASNVIYKNEEIAVGIINDPGGARGNHLKFSLENDTEDYFVLICLPKPIETLSKASYHECEVKAKKIIHLKSSYTAYIHIEDISLPPEIPKRNYFQNITLTPPGLELEKESLMLSTNPEESFMLDLKYPESVEISKRAVMWTRVTEPTLYSTVLSSIDMKKKILKSKIKFEILSPGVFNVTETGGIVYVSTRNILKESFYRIKIKGVYPNGYRFVSSVQINVTDSKSFGDEICQKLGDENLRPSCSEKRNKFECEKTCGISSTILKRSKDGQITTSGCSWRSNEKPEKLSRLYQTCSPDLSTCPDRFCDSLEALNSKICPQDCTEYVFGSANKENHVPGIASATGVCTCDNRQKCLCALVNTVDPLKQSERRKSKQIINDTTISRQREVISAIKASYADQCGTICLLSIVTGSIIVVFGTAAILLMIYRRKLKKRCPNQRPLKEDMVNINYEEYVDRPIDVLRPLTQSAAIKEIPEYYDKKWEFPRHRLTIEETLGEGEFGKVLKARADGIGGNDGSTTVAVKTLKDNAKESELADLISEYQLLKEIDHPNVIHLLGACTKLDGPVYIIIEYAKHGSLRNYLRKHRHFSSEQLSGKESETSYVQTITPKDILTFAWQIAKGMNYLTEMKLVHRDLAARNVLVAEGLICKISDFGLTRDIYEDDTYLKRSKGRVPVKWMALESLADHIYTTKSDVWSYGVVLWELVTTGASPYPGIAGQNLFHLLKSGYRMEKPPNCSNELYQILRSCWQENPSHRPTFKSLVIKLEEMLGEGKNYLDLNPRTVENKTYFSEFLDDERETFFPGYDQSNGDEMLKFRFEMFEKSTKQCLKCPSGKCNCDVNLHYQNENVIPKPKYENEGVEDTGYVQPTGEPKPVNFLQTSGEIINTEKPEILSNTNLGTGNNNKKEIFDVKKI